METAVIINQNELKAMIADIFKECLTDWQPKQSKPVPKEYLTRAQVCQRLHITLPTVHSWMKQEKLKPYHIGGRTLFKESEVMEAVKPVDYSLKEKTR